MLVSPRFMECWMAIRDHGAKPVVSIRGGGSHLRLQADAVQQALQASNPRPRPTFQGFSISSSKPSGRRTCMDHELGPTLA